LSRIDKASSILEDTVGPRDCALLIGAPLDRESFFADLRCPDKEFARHFLRERLNQTEAAQWEAYEPYASLAKDVCDQVRRKGTTVKESATLADFHETVPVMPVTTYVGHWRSACFRSGDIADAGRVRQYLARAGLLVPSKTDAEELPQLVDALNHILDRPNDEYDDVLPGSHGELAAAEYRWQAARHEIHRHLGRQSAAEQPRNSQTGFIPLARLRKACPQSTPAYWI
jgi:hypothetical protein